MKNALIVAFIAFLCGQGHSQIAIYDAVKLKSLGIGSHVYTTQASKISLPQNDDVYRILKYYVAVADSGTKKNIEVAFDNNPFMGYEVKSFGGNTSAGLNLSPGFIGGLDVTNIADGFAKFLVKRVKEELSVAFFNKFREFLSKPEYVDLQTVFPQTYQALTIIGDEIYNYQGYMQTLRESFEKDLSTLPVNLPSIIDNHPAFFTAHKELAAILKSSCYVATQLKDKVHPGDILADYPAEYLDSLNTNWKGAIQTLQLISASLRDTATNTDSIYWVSPKQIKALADPTTFKIYLGLLYQKAKYFNKDSANNDTCIAFAGATLPDILAKAAPVYMQLEAYVTGFSQKADKLNNLIKQYKKPANDSLAIEQYYAYAQAFIDLLKHAVTLTAIPIVHKAFPVNLSVEMQDYFDAAQSASDIVLNVSKRNYGGAVVNAVHIYDLVKTRQAVTDAKKYATSSAPAAAIKKAKNDIVKQVKNAKDIAALQQVNVAALADTSLSSDEKIALANADTLAKLAAVKDVRNNLFKYGSFMAAVVQAKNSDDVESAVEAFAMPSGSSSVKRESAWNIALNAYAGPFIGYEKIKGIDSGKWNSFGITAPIGISISKGHSILFVNNPHGHTSSSFFISLVDLGAVTAFRFTNDSTEKIPTVQLKDIISPGLFYSHGFGKTPLSLNIGYQFGPLLRKVSPDVNNYSNSYSRFSISLCVDIPVLNFYTKSY